MRIYDESGQEQDRAWLDTMFGPQVRVDASPDNPAFRLIEVKASTEKAAVITLRDSKGNPMPGVTVIFAHTSGANTVREKTGQDGQITIPLDRSHRYGVPAQAGPCHAGIPRQPTDVIYGLGRVIVPGAPDRHLDITFQWLDRSDVTEPDPSPEEPEPSPVEAPWQQLFDKLDTIIALLEKLEH
jgi:hypothetical protein